MLLEHGGADCTQVENIQSIRDLIVQMSELQLEERRERRAYEKRIMEILEKLADQGARLSTQEYNARENHTDINRIADKVRSLELSEKEDDPRVVDMHVFYKLTTNKYALYCYASLLGILLVDLITNIVYHGTGILMGIRWVSHIFNGG